MPDELALILQLSIRSKFYVDVGLVSPCEERFAQKLGGGFNQRARLIALLCSILVA
jgi:hypothetical protein